MFCGGNFFSLNKASIYDADLKKPVDKMSDFEIYNYSTMILIINLTGDFFVLLFVFNYLTFRFCHHCLFDINAATI